MILPDESTFGDGLLWESKYPAFAFAQRQSQGTSLYRMFFLLKSQSDIDGTLGNEFGLAAWKTQ
jgi:hypothetical protein